MTDKHGEHVFPSPSSGIPDDINGPYTIELNGKELHSLGEILVCEGSEKCMIF
jgi:hypothetical protein